MAGEVGIFLGGADRLDGGEGVAAEEERLRAVGKLSKIADDEDRTLELFNAGALPALLALLPPRSSLSRASELEMPLVGVAIEALGDGRVLLGALLALGDRRRDRCQD